MSRYPVPVPSEVSPAGDVARRLARTLGPACPAADGTARAADLLALGGALSDSRATLRTALDQAFANTATDLLPELEARRGLALERRDLTDAERQQRLLAKTRGSFSGSPQDILAAVRAIDPTATLRENLYADVAATDPLAVYRLAVLISAATYANAELLAQIRRLVRPMKSAWTEVAVGVGAAGFLCDDPNSLTDRDLLGS